MTPCNRHKNNISRYLNSKAEGGELENLSTHLRICAHCRAQLEEERALSRLLRQTCPLYMSPPALRARVSALLARGSAPQMAARPLHETVPA
jgi:anti-sigma factor RsiW